MNKRKIRQEIIDAKEMLEEWQPVNDALFGGRMNNSTLSRIATDEDYFPVRKDIVAILCPPKPKPDKRLRPVQHLCTGAEYEAMLKYSTRERTLNAL